MHPAKPEAEATDRAAPILSARGLVMDFPGVRALDRVDFDVRAGEVHALMGENGAGKSTLIKVLSGLYRPSEGSILSDGRQIRARRPRDAESAGISTVYQEIDLVPTMTVADNICLGRQPTRFGLIDHAAARARARAALERLDLQLDVGRTLGEYPIAVQQLVAISRALDTEARVLILDEPTSSLDADETRELFRVVRRLRGQGLGIVFVTHFLDQVYEISDRITVLRNGARVSAWETGQLTKSALIEAMTGRKIEQLHRAAPGSDGAAALDRPVLEFTDLGRAQAVAPTSARVHAGESLGLAGLLGSGRSELARLIFGADRPDRGTVRVGGAGVRTGSVRDAIAHGMAFTPEDRKGQGLVLDLSVRENIVLALQARRALRPIRQAEQDRLANHYISTLKIKTPTAETPVGNLSGGNQQKVLLARWLATRPRVLILDEPTRGIDVGARAEIESLIASLREQGMAIVFISSELEEIVRTCGRALVLRDRKVVGEVTGDRVDEATILSLIAGPAAGAGGA